MYFSAIKTKERCVMNDGMYLEDFIEEYYDLEDEEDICDLLEGLSMHDGIEDLLVDIEEEREFD
jgi:hypothetical protein